MISNLLDAVGFKTYREYHVKDVGSIDIFVLDHDGYVTRIKAAMQALGINPERLIHSLCHPAGGGVG